MYCKFAAVFTYVILLQITLILHLRLSVILALLLSSDLARTTRLCTFREHVLMKVRPCCCQTVCGPFASGVKGGGLIHVCISLELFQFLATSVSFLGAKAVRFKLKRRNITCRRPNQMLKCVHEPGLCGVLYPDERALCVGLGLDSDTWNLLDVGINSWHDCMSEHLSLLVKARFHVCFEKLTVKVASFQYIWGMLFPLNLSLATWSSVGFSCFFHKISEHGCYLLCRQPAMEQFYDSEEVKASTWPIWWWLPEHGRFRLDYIQVFQGCMVLESSLSGQFLYCILREIQAGEVLSFTRV